MKLHLGCGKRDFGNGWIHIDSADFPHVVCSDIVNLPFKSNSCDLVYASHVLEYFDREQGIQVLTEWVRVLKPGGVLRIAVPNFKAICGAYLDSGFSLSNLIGPLYGKMGNPPIYHKTVYDYFSLDESLKAVGLKDIRCYDWRHTEHSQFDDHSQAYLPHMDKANGLLISLNMEGVK